MSPPEKLSREYDAVVLTGGAEKPRDLPVPGRELKGIHFAMEFLPQQNRRVSGEAATEAEPILAGGKHVVVIGGGDTGSDCIGTSIRQGALSVTQLRDHAGAAAAREQGADLAELAAQAAHLVEPRRRRRARLRRDDARFSGANGFVKKLHCVHVDDKMKPIPGSEFEIDAELVLLAMGFVHPVHEGMIKSLGLALDQRGNVGASTDDYRTSVDKVFAAGDMRRGQSLVVWAIREGRQAARAVDEFLMGASLLPK